MISVCVPTLQRPKRLEKMLQSARDTMHDKSAVEFLFYIDENDDVTKDYRIIRHFPDLKLRFFRQPPVPISGMRYNFLAAQAHGDIFMYSSDDMIYLSKNWDLIVEDKFSQYPDKILLVAPLLTKRHRRNIGIVGFVSRRQLEIIGMFFTEYFPQWYDDKWLSRTYQTINRYIEETNILMSHQHYSKDKTLFDNTYAKYVNGEHNLDYGRKVFIKNQAEIQIWADKLREALIQ